MDLASELEIGLAMELAGAEFVGIGADDDCFEAGNEAALEFDGFAEAGLRVERIFVGEDTGVGRDDVVFRDGDVEGAGDEVGKTEASFHQGQDGVEIGSGHAVAGGDGAMEEFHGGRERSTG